jgi:hypothetical protein
MNTKPDADQLSTDKGKVVVEDQTSRLLNTYLIAGWAALTILMIMSGLLYRRMAVADLIREVEAQNTSFASEFERLSWPEFSEYVVDVAPASSRDELQEHPEVERFRQLIVEQAGSLPVVRVKLYTREGLTVFSTTTDDIGQYSNDVASQEYYRGYFDDDDDFAKLTHHDSFETLDGTIKDCDLVSSYDALPTRRYRPEGILEITQDVTPSLQSIKRNQAAIIGIGVFLVALLLGISAVLSGRTRSLNPLSSGR